MLSHRRGRRPLLACTPPLVIAIGLLSGLARADAEAGAADAASLVRRGVELRREERNEEALAAFAQAFILSKKPSVRAQLGLAEQAVGRWVAAERDLDAALTVNDDPWITKNRAALTAAREVVLQHLGWITVEVNTPAATLIFDGQPMTPFVETRTVARTLTLETRAEGYVPDVRVVVVEPEKHLHVVVALAPAPEMVAADARKATVLQAQTSPAPLVERARPLSGHTNESSGSVLSTVGWVGVGAGIVGLAVGGGFGIEAAVQKSACGGRGCPAWNDASVANVGFALGGALAATGLVLVLAAPRGESGRATAFVVPVITAKGGGVGAGFSFR